jgi:hypothetical protein
MVSNFCSFGVAKMDNPKSAEQSIVHSDNAEVVVRTSSFPADAGYPDFAVADHHTLVVGE